MFGLQPLLDHLLIFRTCHFAGVYGGGKTALAVECAIRFVLNGDVSRIVSNVPLAFEASDTCGVNDLIDIKDAAIIIDEAWNFLEAGNFKKAKEFLAYPRHRNQVLMFPSVTNLTSYVQFLRVKRFWSGLKVGVPLWLYRLEIEPKEYKNRKPPRGKIHWCYWWQPQSIFGFYQHNYRDKALDPSLFHIYEAS